MSYTKWSKMTLVFILSCCAPFSDSPFSDHLIRSERNLNMKNLALIGNVEADSKIRIPIFTDSHQNYKGLDKVIYELNKLTAVDFVVSLGDFTNNGYNYEFDQFISSYTHIKWPKFTLIGNHDAIGAGSKLYTKAFGVSNFYFETTSIRFIFFNSNNWEDKQNFNPTWLKETVESSAKPIVIFTHIPLRDKERFLNNEYTPVFDQIINHPLVKLIINGHNHSYSLQTDNGTIALQIERVADGDWRLIDLDLNNNRVCIYHLGLMESEICRNFK